MRVQGAGLPTGLAAGGAEGPPKKSSISPGGLAFQLSRGHLSPSTLPHSPMACWCSYFYRKVDKSTEVNPVVSFRHRSKMAKVVQRWQKLFKDGKSCSEWQKNIKLKSWTQSQVAQTSSSQFKSNKIKSNELKSNQI